MHQNNGCFSRMKYFKNVRPADYCNYKVILRELGNQKDLPVENDHLLKSVFIFLFQKKNLSLATNISMKRFLEVDPYDISSVCR